MSVIYTPNNVFKEIETSIYEFLWNGKRDKVKRSCITSDFTKGGIKIPDIALKVNALSANWAKRIIDPKFAKWKLIPTSYMDYFGKDLIVFKMNFNTDLHFPFIHDSHLPIFYKHVIINWHKSNVCDTQATKLETIKNEVIWGNRYILSNNCTLFMKNWINSGFIFIGDICTVDGFMLLRDIYSKCTNKTAKFMLEYKIILDSIPKEWRHCIKNNIDEKWQHNDNIFKWNDKIYSYSSINNINCKSIYTFLIDEKTTRAHCETGWELLFCKDIDWRDIWLKQTIKLTPNMKLAEFNFKMIHNNLPSGKLLHRWKIEDSDLCILCNVEDDYKHMFLECKRLKLFWTQIIRLLRNTLNITVKNNYELLVLGYRSTNDNTQTINIVLTLAKYTIFKSWCKNRKIATKFGQIYLYNIFKYDLYSYSSIHSHDDITSSFIQRLCHQV